METPKPPLPGLNVPERETLIGFLDYQRALLRHKASGLTDEQLRISIPPSDLTLAGLLNHMAVVELDWFVGDITDGDLGEPWTSAPWDEDRNWEHTSALNMTGDELFARYDDAIERCRAVIDGVDSLDQPSIREHPRLNEPWSVRWILVHMIEEYARHCGHADFIRQAIDGQTGDWD